MGLFSRSTKAATMKPEATATGAGNKILLNFDLRTSRAVLEMAAATLESGAADARS